jgi:geranylgeranyl diphosphate synthase type I
MQHIWAGRREQLSEAIGRSLDTLHFSHGQLVREQIEAADPAGYEVAAMACLSAAEAAGGSVDAALPGAVALALISEMGFTFRGLENSGGAASLSTAWGMPRALNAGDSMFALAQDALLSIPDEVTAEARLQATMVFDRGVRALIESMFDAGGGAPASNCQRSLLPAAMALGGLLAGADLHRVKRLEQLGREWSALPEDELARQLASDPSGWLAS